MGPDPFITLEALHAAFEDAGEDFPRDLSGVHVAVVRDCHYDLDLTVEISVFGRAEEEPLYQEIVKGAHHSAAYDEVERTGTISAETVRALFEEDLRTALTEVGRTISLNRGRRTEASLAPGETRANSSNSRSSDPRERRCVVPRAAS